MLVSYSVRSFMEGPPLQIRSVGCGIEIKGDRDIHTGVQPRSFLASRWIRPKDLIASS